MASLTEVVDACDLTEEEYLELLDTKPVAVAKLLEKYAETLA